VKTQGRLSFQLEFVIENIPFASFQSGVKQKEQMQNFFIVNGLIFFLFIGDTNSRLNLEFQQVKDKHICCLPCINFTVAYVSQRGGKLCAAVDATLL